MKNKSLFMAMVFILISSLAVASVLNLAAGTVHTGDLKPVQEITAPGSLSFVSFKNNLDTARRDYLLSKGIQLIGYVQENVYLVFLRPGYQHDLLNWAGMIPPDIKISPEITTAGTVVVHRVDLAHTSARKDQTLRPREGTYRSRQTLTLDQIKTLAAEEDVIWIEPAPRGSFRNDISSWVIQSDIPYVYSLYNHGLTGKNQIIGHIDGDPLIESCYFYDPDHEVGPEHRKFIGFRSSWYEYGDGHGTHTAGTAAGFAAEEPNNGIAYDARISHTNYYDMADDSIPLYQSFVLAHEDGARVHTNSWGDDYTTSYTEWCADIDAFSHEYEDSLVLFASTNSRSLKTPENAKNVLAVGATYQYPDETIIFRGGEGPTIDGRIKPEIFAPGNWIYSASSSSDCATTPLSGTSMASPTVAAGAALIREYFEKGYYPTGNPGGVPLSPSGSLVKAILLASTRDMESYPGYPNFQEGWGQLVLDDALLFPNEKRRMFVSDYRHASGMAENQIHSYTIDVKSSDEPLRVVLVWADEPALPLSSDIVINNLDLILSAPVNTYTGNGMVNGESVPGADFDPLNNVEQIILSNPDPGLYSIDVIATSVPLPYQGYALVVLGDFDINDSKSIPGVTHAQGALGTLWQSDLVLSNFGSEPETIRLHYQPAGWNQPPQSKDLELPADSVMAITDAGSMFEGDLILGYIDTQTPPEVNLTMRTYHNSATGGFGQSISSNNIRLREGMTVYFTGITHDADSRTNFGWINRSSRECRLTLELLAEDGFRKDSAEVVIPGNHYIQFPYTEYFHKAVHDRATIRLTVNEGDDLEAYVSIIDNHSGDAKFMPALQPLQSGYIPVISRSRGADGELWKSGLSIHNPLSTNQKIMLNSRLLDSGMWKTISNEINVPSEATVYFEDIVLQAFGCENALGYLEIDGLVTAASYLYTGNDSLGRRGQYVAYMTGPEVSHWRVLSYPPLGRKTNIGVVNRSDTSRFCSFTPIGSNEDIVVGIPEKNLGQWNTASLFSEPGSAWTVDCDGPVFIYASSIDKATGDAVFIPAFVKNGLGFRW